jgi:heme/copper-type cytochrome/quinol oxidase subunit 4
MEQSNQLGDTGHPMSLVITIVLLGLLASLSPATIVVFILLLATTRAKVNAAAFLIGWGVSLVVVFSVSYAVGGTHGAQHGGGRTAVEIIEILLGMGLIFAAERQWQTRNQPKTPSGVTRNLAARLQRLNPWQAAIVGVLKQPWALTAAAAVVVIRDHAAWEVAVIAFLLFTVVSTATVGLTFLYFARRPGDAQQHLEALRDRVVRAGPTIAVVVYLMVGLYLIADGVRGVVNS